MGLRYTEFISINTQAIKELDNKLSKLACGLSGDVKVWEYLNYQSENDEIIKRLETLENRGLELEPIIEECDHSELKEEIKQLKIENKKQEDCISQLISDNMNLNDKVNMLMEKLEKLINVKPAISMNIIETDDGEDTGYDILNGKINDLEKQINKIDNKVKKLTTGYNKMIKNM